MHSCELVVWFQPARLREGVEGVFYCSFAMDMSDVAPLLLPEGEGCHGYHGFIEASGRQWAMHLHVPPDKSHRDAQYGGYLAPAGAYQRSRSQAHHAAAIPFTCRFSCEPGLRHLLRGVEPALKRQLRQSASLAAFVQGLRATVQRLSGDARQHNDGQLAKALAKVVNDLGDLGWDKVVDCNTALTSISVRPCSACRSFHPVLLKN